MVALPGPVEELLNVALVGELDGGCALTAGRSPIRSSRSTTASTS